ncbi:hypothetical protein AARAC_008408 [Aspergillus arachidicola]|uniref:Transcription factor domain-containing protein n=1 Tax=Aspergillus arachidicola TaxID=656916 RepID=A0A2G7G835_9EURO|nr:hypothetical protein AARAC_008408 [Aspergillus arachidicola]
MHYEYGAALEARGRVTLIYLDRESVVVVVDDLFFDRAYPFAPIGHQQRYYARTTHESDAREPFTSLQYAMRTLAASMGTQFQGVLPLLYTHTNCLLEVWEQNMPNEALLIDVVQAAGHCFHLVHLVKLDRIDDPNSWQTSSLSWVEIEEIGRTFWTAYALDRYANLANGLPLALNDQMANPHPPTRSRDRISTSTGCYDRISGLGYGEKGRPAAITLREIDQRILNPTSQECIAHHRALGTILSHEVQTTLSSVAAGFEPCDPTVFFTDMLTQTTVLVLFTALNSVPEAADMLQDLYGSYETKASMAMKRVLGQAQKLSRIGSFKARLVHPFAPIALFIGAEFSRSCEGFNHKLAAQFKAISAALINMEPVNNLARMLELELQRNLEIVPVAIGF